LPWFALGAAVGLLMAARAFADQGAPGWPYVTMAAVALVAAAAGGMNDPR
jgi:hypothetical protein